MRRLLTTVVVVGGLCVTGCVRKGPSTIPKDRFDYAEAIGRSSDAQTLLAIVKLRYSEWPQFVEVNQIVAGYNWEQAVDAGIGSIGSGAPRGEGGWAGRYIERPTITYTPLAGAKFVQAILTPLRPAVLLSLIRAGWPADRLFETMVTSVNGKSNRAGGPLAVRAADPLFVRFARALRSAQSASALAVGIPDSGVESEALEFSFHYAAMEPDARSELADVLTELGLDPEAGRYRVLWSPFPVDPDVLALQTHSVLQLMILLSSSVEVPEEHLSNGWAVRYAEAASADGEPPLVRIRCGEREPETCLVKVQHGGYWFWIDQDDIRSKLTFAYLSLVLTVTATGTAETPQLTISTN